MSITTVDGVTKNIGDEVYQIGYHFHFPKNSDSKYYPMLCGVDELDVKFKDDGSVLYFDSKKLCEEQCRMMNEKPKI